MKKILMAVMALIMTVGTLSAQKHLYVWKTDGTYISVPVNEVDSIGFYMPESIGGSGATDGIGAFSVSETQQVTFSKGNMQYQAITNSWRFAEHQWDYIGETNKNISDTYSGWIDLFGWGTGNAPTMTNPNATVYGTFIDWGMNPISNGGNKAGLWRALSKDEWAYLFHGRENYDKLFGMGSVEGVNGVILLPDNWEDVKPSGVSFRSGVEEGFIWSTSYYTCSGSGCDHFSDNTYIAKQWEAMELAGAVFLPAAGGRSVLFGTKVNNAGSEGCYWSSTQYGSEDAYTLGFNTYQLYTQWGGMLYSGLSVRLVQVLQN